MDDKKKYGCADYQKEMVLLGLKKKLNNKNLSEENKEDIIKEIKRLEKQLGLD